MSWIDVIGGIGGGGVTGFLGFLGARRVARSSEQAADRQAKLDSRRVSLDEFEVFKKTYREEREEDHQELARLRGLLRTAVSHISSLRATMNRSQIPPPPLPDDLVNFSLGGFEPSDN